MPLKPQQKLWILKVSAIPKLMHQLVLTPQGAGILKSMDVKIQGAVRSWLKLPKDIPKAMFSNSVRDDGLGIFSLVEKVPRWQYNRICKMDSSDAGLVQLMIQNDFMRTWRDKLISAYHVDEPISVGETRLHDNLIKKCDERGLRRVREEAARCSNDWLTDGTLLIPGHRFIDAAKLKSNCVPTDERCNHRR